MDREKDGRNQVRAPANAWLTEHRRYFEYLDLALEDLRAIAAQIVAAWPSGADDSMAVESMTPILHKLCRRRDLLGDVIPVIAAMAVESFLNFFGVYLLGEARFHETVEKKPASEKLRELLKHAAEPVPLGEAEIMQVLKAVMSRRHALAHPKAREVPFETDIRDWPREPLIERSARAVEDCHRFFRILHDTVPSARPLLPAGIAA